MRRTSALLLAALVILPLGCSRPQGDQESFCELAPDVEDLFALLQGFESADPAELDRRFDAGLEQYQALERSAPRKIKSDVAELVDIVEEVLAAVRENGDDRAAIASDLETLQDDHPGAATAGLKVIQYAKDECDVDLQTGPTPGMGPGGGTAPTDTGGQTTPSTSEGGSTVPGGPSTSGSEAETETETESTTSTTTG